MCTISAEEIPAVVGRLDTIMSEASQSQYISKPMSMTPWTELNRSSTVEAGDVQASGIHSRIDATHPSSQSSAERVTATGDPADATCTSVSSDTTKAVNIQS